MPSFLNLPSELHLHILAFLDYATLTGMKRVHRVIRDLLEAYKSIIRDALSRYEVEMQSCFGEDGCPSPCYYPCYKCLKPIYWAYIALPGHDRSGFRLGGPKRAERACRACDSKQHDAFTVMLQQELVENATVWDRLDDTCCAGYLHARETGLDG